MKVSETVEALLKPVVNQMGYMLDEVEFQKEQGNWVLTLYIEYEDGRRITIDDCEAVSRAVDPVLDEADPIEQAYFLSVSSIGIDRPLKKDRDFQRNMDKLVTLKLYAPRKGKKELTGKLTAFDENTFTVTLKDSGEEVKFQRKEVAMVRPYIDFNSIVNIDDNLEIEEIEE